LLPTDQRYAGGMTSSLEMLPPARAAKDKLPALPPNCLAIGCCV